MMRSSAIKHDFYSIYPTFTWFTNDPTDFCSSYAHIWNKLKCLDDIDFFLQRDNNKIIYLKCLYNEANAISKKTQN